MTDYLDCVFSPTRSVGSVQSAGRQHTVPDCSVGSVQSAGRTSSGLIPEVRFMLEDSDDYHAPGNDTRIVLTPFQIALWVRFRQRDALAPE